MSLYVYRFNADKEWLKACSWVCFLVHNKHSSEFDIFHLLRCELLARVITKYLRQNLWIFIGNRLTIICHDWISLTIDTSIIYFIKINWSLSQTLSVISLIRMLLDLALILLSDRSWLKPLFTMESKFPFFIVVISYSLRASSFLEHLRAF